MLESLRQSTTGAGKDITFGFDELFFSRTDPRGVIQYGNEVFVRISGYPFETLVGAGHNIVRHPEMPKTIFKLFWDTIQSGRPIAAYVNNRAADGSNYWVMAVAFPINGGYLSVRQRPSSRYFDAIREIYPEVLRHEAEQGLEAGGKRLGELLAKLGFRDYEAFMTEALREEIICRDSQIEALRRSARTDGESMFPEISGPAGAGVEIFLRLFRLVRDFTESREVFEKETRRMLTFFSTIGHLSVNMMVSAERLGDAGVTLAVVAREFQRLAGEIESHLRQFIGAVELLERSVTRSNFGISSLKLQMDMIEFFVLESLRRARADEAARRNAFKDLEENQQSFVSLTESSARLVTSSLSELRSKLEQFNHSIGEIDTFISGIEIVRQKGRVESVLSPEALEAFNNQLNTLRDFTATTKSATTQLRNSTRVLTSALQTIEADLPRGRNTMRRVFEAALGRSAH